MKGRLLFVIGSLDYGGAERHLVRLLPALAANWDIAVFTLTAPGAQAEILQTQGVAVHAGWMKPRPNAGFIFRLFRQIAAASALCAHIVRWRPNLVHFFLPQAYLVGAPCALLMGVRNLVMSRRSRRYYQLKHPLMAKMERILHKFMKAVLGNSQAVISDLREEGVRESKLGLIYNTVDLQEFAPRTTSPTRSDLGVPDEAIMLVMVANLIPYKGHQDLIGALAEVDAAQDWRMVFVGRNTDHKKQLDRQVKGAGLESKVIWLGERTDIAELLSLADVGVLTSHEEGFSNAILEYMASELPVIATDVGGACEAVVDGETGIIVPPRDNAALCAALRTLMNDEKRGDMGKKGRERLERIFSFSRSVANYEALYNGLLRGEGVPAALSPATCADGAISCVD